MVKFAFTLGMTDLHTLTKVTQRHYRQGITLLSQ